MSYPGLPALIGNQFYGVKDRCLSFDGTDDYVLVEAGTDITSLTAMSFEGWVKPKKNARTQRFMQIACDISHNNTIGLILRSFDNIFINGRKSDGGIVRSEYIEFTDQTWNHFAMTRTSGGVHKFYWNGEEVAWGDGVEDGTIDGLHGEICFSGLWRYSNTPPDAVHFGEGLLDEVRIWNHARTAEQIKRYMHTRLYGTETGLVAYYPMDEGTGSTAYDMSQNSNNGTITGATWIKP